MLKYLGIYYFRKVVILMTGKTHIAASAALTTALVHVQDVKSLAVVLRCMYNWWNY